MCGNNYRDRLGFPSDAVNNNSNIGDASPASASVSAADASPTLSVVSASARRSNAINNMLVAEPVLITSLKDQNLFAVDGAAGVWHSFCIMKNHKIYACGSNGKGQLGIPGMKLCQQFTQVPLKSLLGKYTPVKIVCGNLFSVLLASST